MVCSDVQRGQKIASLGLPLSWHLSRVLLFIVLVSLGPLRAQDLPSTGTPENLQFLSSSELVLVQNQDLLLTHENDAGGLVSRYFKGKLSTVAQALRQPFKIAANPRQMELYVCLAKTDQEKAVLQTYRIKTASMVGSPVVLEDVTACDRMAYSIMNRSVYLLTNDARQVYAYRGSKKKLTKVFSFSEEQIGRWGKASHFSVSNDGQRLYFLFEKEGVSSYLQLSLRKAELRELTQVSGANTFSGSTMYQNKHVFFGKQPAAIWLWTPKKNVLEEYPYPDEDNAHSIACAGDATSFFSLVQKGQEVTLFSKTWMSLLKRTQK